MVDFAALRGNTKNSLDAAKELSKKMGQTNDYKDERIWKPTWKLVSNDSYVSENIIRFLPSPYVDMVAVEEGTLEMATPIVSLKKHFFRCAKGYYVENSLSTFGEDCPIAAHDMPLWKQWKDEGKPDDKRKKTLISRIAKEEKYCNIFVVQDKNKPENNGKVFLYKVGVSIFEKIEAALNPQFDGVKPFDAFDLFNGANMLLNLVGKKQKFGNVEYVKPAFDEVRWGKTGRLFEDDDLMEKAWKECYSLAEMIDRKNFKTYDELEKIFFTKMGYDVEDNTSKNTGAQSKSLSDFESQDDPAPTPKKKSVVDVEDGVSTPSDEPSTGSNLSEFEAMLKG